MRERITITIRADVLKKLDAVIDGEKIRNRSNAIETIVEEKFKDSVLQKAVIVGAGKVATLNGKTISKTLFPIGGKTLIEKNIEILKSAGVSEIIMDIGKWRKDLEKVLGNEGKLGVRIIYYEKAEGTAAVLRHMKHELGGTFVMANADILLESIDLNDMYAFHKKHRGAGTIAVATHKDPTELGSIFMKGNQILDFKEKIKEDNSLIVNAGVYILEPNVCDLVPEGFSEIEHDVFPKLAQSGKLFGYQAGKNWVHLHDEGKYKEYLNKQK